MIFDFTGIKHFDYDGKYYNSTSDGKFLVSDDDDNFSSPISEKEFLDIYVKKLQSMGLFNSQTFKLIVASYAEPYCLYRLTIAGSSPLDKRTTSQTLVCDILSLYPFLNGFQLAYIFYLLNDEFLDCFRAKPRTRKFL